MAIGRTWTSCGMEMKVVHFYHESTEESFFSLKLERVGRGVRSSNSETFELGVWILERSFGGELPSCTVACPERSRTVAFVVNQQKRPAKIGWPGVRREKDQKAVRVPNKPCNSLSGGCKRQRALGSRTKAQFFGKLAARNLYAGPGTLPPETSRSKTRSLTDRLRADQFELVRKS